MSLTYEDIKAMCLKALHEFEKRPRYLSIVPDRCAECCGARGCALTGERGCARGEARAKEARLFKRQRFLFKGSR